MGLRLTSKREIRRISLRVSYDGTDYHGWQKQPLIDATVQGTIERTLSHLLGTQHSVDGASRTDAGVHAEDQLLAFSTAHPIRLDGLVRALNKKLPASIGVRSPQEVPLDFQPRFANFGKRYRYQLYTSPTKRPLIDRYATWLHYPLDLELVQEGMMALIGERDFASFAASNGQHKTTIRNLWGAALQQSALTEGGELIALEFSGSAFMKQMVRNLVGTLIELGRGQWSIERFHEAIEARSRSAAGPTAPARGLCLMEMYWPKPPQRILTSE